MATGKEQPKFEKGHFDLFSFVPIICSKNFTKRSGKI
jgi:hypothetical protein